MFWGSVREGPLATSKAIRAKNVTFKKSLGFSNFSYRDYFNPLKTSNICKFSGIEFLGPNPKLRRRKKNLSWGGYVLHKTFCQGISHYKVCYITCKVFFFANLSLPSPSSLKKLPNLFNRDFTLWSRKKTFSFGHIISPLLAKLVQSR